ncbi:MAG: MFS transporter, partial [Actinomycetes bacterium]
MSGPRLERDRLTWVTYLQLGSYGYFLYGVGPSLSLLRDELDISRTVAGLHGTALAVGALASALVLAPAVRRLGRGPVIWGGLALLALGVVVYTAASVLPLTLVGAFLGSFGGSFAITSSAAVLTDRHGPGGAAAVTEANAVAAGVGLLAPLMVGLGVISGLGWRPAMLLVVPVLVVTAVVGRSVAVPAPASGSVSRDLGRLPGRYWVSWTVLTAGIAVEFCMTLWAADLLRDRTALSSAGAAAGVTAIVAGMAAGRFAGGRLALRHSADNLLLAALATVAVGFAAFWLTRHPAVALAGIVVCGLGIALCDPLALVRASAAAGARPALASA